MARTLNGTVSDLLRANRVAAFDVADDFTFAAWVKRASSGTIHGIFNVQSDGTGYLRYGADNKLALIQSNVVQIVASTVTVTDSAWHHTATTKTGATFKLYLDGSDVTAAGANATCVTATNPLTVGGDGFGAVSIREFFNGRIAEVCLWGSALTASEIKSLSVGASPVFVHPDDLRGYWPLFGNSVEPSYAPSSNDLTVTGTTVSNHPGVMPGLGMR
jgi:hypothetical protein